MQSQPDSPSPLQQAISTLRIGATLAVALAAPIISAAENSISSGPFPKFAQTYCTDCHNPTKKKGKLDLETLLKADPSQHRDTWEEIAIVLQEREMPPTDEPDLKRPNASEYQRITTWLTQSVLATQADAASSEVALTTAAAIQTYCVNCHNPDELKGGLDLESLLADEPTEHPDIWEHVVTRLQARQMPPPTRKRPSEEQYQTLLTSLTGQLDHHAVTHPQPGRVETFRRLNRTEYQNAIRDLLALDIDAASLLPLDEESHGFDNITVANLSPAFVDRYITAAQKISRLAIGRPNAKPGGETFRTAPDLTQEKHIEGLPIGTRGGMLIDYTFPEDGEYEIEVHLRRDRNEHVEGLNGTHQMDVLIDRALIEQFTITRKGHKSHNDVDKHLKLRTFVKAGPKKVGVTFPKRAYSLLQNKRQPFAAHFNLHRHPRLTPAIYEVSITGPYEGQGALDTPSRRKIFVDYPTSADDTEIIAKKILTRLARLAYRRPPSAPEVEKLMTFYRTGERDQGFDNGIEQALKAILVSPNFLFRIERDPPTAAPGSAYPLADRELASRLAFFLWSSLPDDELHVLAAEGRLQLPDVLESQVSRMLADPRAESLVSNFAGQWLHLRNLESITPDLRLFPDFDDNLRQAFRRETELFVGSIIRENQSVLRLLQSDYTFLNERLAHHYEIPGVFGSRFRRVALEPDQNRGGLLRQGSILTVTSYATRTSPVIRGNWVLENILGTPPPPPPPDVPALEENSVDASLSMRERLAVHRANPACASCHDLMDPVGFALESFDAVGRWRDYENGQPIDVSGGLPDGSVFAGVKKLEEGLLERPELFVGTLTRKLLTFALGRGLEPYDAPAVRQIVREAAAQDYRFSALVTGIAKSVPFRLRAVPETNQIAAQ